MKFGEHLKRNIYAPWREHYIAYDELKAIIKILSKSGITSLSPQAGYKDFTPSLSVGQAQEAEMKVNYKGKELSEEDFFVALDQNLVSRSDI